MNTIYIIKEKDDWEKLITYITKHFPGKRIFLLSGNLGAGKTTFVQHFGQYLNISHHITSPTFSIVHEYEIPHTQKKLYHFDLYRIQSIQELQSIGFEDYLLSDNYCCIEWPEICLPILNEHHSIKNQILNINIYLNHELNLREVTLYK